ncbi:MAG: hypothetical protein J5529_09470 [Prevotella sp.]|nr:hypothetical protein [Prevotella sp.]
MNKFTYSLLSLLLFLPLGISAQEDITIIVNDESQIVTGTVITISDTEEYIDTETNLYQVTGKNTFMLGDINENGHVDVSDVVSIVDIYFDDENSKVADMNENGYVSTDDAIIGVDTVFGEVEEKVIVESYEVEDITNLWICSKTTPAVDQH